ncbi:MAG: HTTM domain-containing protein [Planctomycetaceae bacterium]
MRSCTLRFAHRRHRQSGCGCWFQIGMPYFYGGLAKLNYDWLRDAHQALAGAAYESPCRRRMVRASVGPSSFAYGGLIFDLLIVRPPVATTRVIAYFLCLCFRGQQCRLWEIGMP